MLWSFSELPLKLLEFCDHDVIDKANQFLFSFFLEYLPKLTHNWYLQEEEQFRNSVMHDLLYVSADHPLSRQIYSYYQHNYQLPQHERCYWMIDTNARLVIFFISW